MLKVCRFCGIEFEADHISTAYCSKGCRKRMRDIKHKEWNDSLYGEADFIPRINFVPWEDRFDEADRLTQISMLQGTLGVSYGTLQTASEMKWGQMVMKAKEIHRKADKEMLEGIIEKNKKIDERNNSKNKTKRRGSSWSL